MEASADMSNRQGPVSLDDLPPLYQRINWAALLIPPLGVILLMLAAIYVFPNLRRRYRRSHNRRASSANNRPHPSEERMIQLTDIPRGERSVDDSDRTVDNGSVGTLERPPSTPTHKQIMRTTPTPSPRLGRMSLSPSPPLASEEDILF